MLNLFDQAYSWDKMISMALVPGSLENHPDGEQVNKIDPEAVSYRTNSKWEDRVCGNCGWYDENMDIQSLPEQPSDIHAQGDRKGPVHRCLLVGGGIAKGGYCSAWGTKSFCGNVDSRRHEEEEEEKRLPCSCNKPETLSDIAIKLRKRLFQI